MNFDRQRMGGRGCEANAEMGPARETSRHRWMPARALALATMVAGLLVTTVTLADDTSYRVSPGDVLAITVYAGDQKHEDISTTISREGLITCPLIGDVHVAGLTTPEIASGLRDSLARDYYVDPQVLVSVREYAGKVYVMGEVRHPGVIGLQERLTVLNACILAGGFTEFASPGRVRVTRIHDGTPRVIGIDLARVKRGKIADLVLEAGDRIDVPSRRF
jgi:protein involved in polysaccharide export with SLBB domain